MRAVSTLKNKIAGRPAPGAPDGFVPVYLKSYDKQLLRERVEEGLEALRSCRLCPRDCRADRWNGETATCHTGRHAVVASWGAHHGEESCLRGWQGSGTIFFSFCNLRCVFCQNWDTSQGRSGREMTAAEIAGIMLSLQEAGCHNINLVTPEHVVPQVLEAAVAAIEQGLRLPIVYNTGGYDSPRSLELLDGVVDIYMPDFKFWRPETAHRLCLAKDYPETARRAVCEMHRQVGPLQIGPDGLARRGVLVRHLVMPGQTDEAREIFRFLAAEVSRETYLNIMAQYHPANKADRYPEINRRILPEEIERAYRAAREAGLHRFDGRREG